MVVCVFGEVPRYTWASSEFVQWKCTAVRKTKLRCHLRWCLFLCLPNSVMKQMFYQPRRPGTLFKKRLWHRCFPGNFVKFSITPFLQNTSGRLPLRSAYMGIVLVFLLLNLDEYLFIEKNSIFSESPRGVLLKRGS